MDKDEEKDMTEVRDSAGKGKGIFTVKKIPEGQELISQKPTVLGPKQTSPFVCVNCLDYINEVSGRFKAMKSSSLLGPFCGSEFWGFFLLKI